MPVANKDLKRLNLPMKWSLTLLTDRAVVVGLTLCKTHSNDEELVNKCAVRYLSFDKWSNDVLLVHSRS